MALSFPQKILSAIDDLRGEYPDPRSVLIPVLKMAQEEFGHLSPEVMAYVGELLEVPESVVAGVATFYHYEILGIEAGGTSDDGLITVREVECLAACGTAPALIIDDDYYEGFEPRDCQRVVDELRAGRKPEGGTGTPGGDIALPGEGGRP